MRTIERSEFSLSLSLCVSVSLSLSLSLCLSLTVPKISDVKPSLPPLVVLTKDLAEMEGTLSLSLLLLSYFDHGILSFRCTRSEWGVGVG